jgi:hypothetical protein
MDKHLRSVWTGMPVCIEILSSLSHNRERNMYLLGTLFSDFPWLSIFIHFEGFESREGCVLSV